MNGNLWEFCKFTFSFLLLSLTIYVSNIFMELEIYISNFVYIFLVWGKKMI